MLLQNNEVNIEEVCIVDLLTANWLLQEDAKTAAAAATSCILNPAIKLDKASLQLIDYKAKSVLFCVWLSFLVNFAGTSF